MGCNIIYKYDIPTFEFSLMLPIDAEVLSAQWQPHRSIGVMWVKQNTSNAKTMRKFQCFATGEAIGNEAGHPPMAYIDTFQTDTGLVFHLFEIL